MKNENIKDNTINQNIGDVIRTKRIELGYSQEDLAKLMGFKSRSSIFKIEKGIAVVTVEQLKEFCKILKINFNKLFLDVSEYLVSDYLAIKSIILYEKFKLEKKQKQELISLANNYYFDFYKDFFEDLIVTGQLDKLHNYPLPFDDKSNDKDVVDFCYHYNLIDNNYIFNKIKFKDLKYIEDKKKINLSQNKKIQDLQKEIIDITTKIDNVEIIEDIRDIAKLKLDKSNNKPK